MARPTATQRLDAIVDAAVTVFGRDGYASAQVADIAREAGVSVGTVYNYVTGKDALLVLAVERELLGGALDPSELPASASAGLDYLRAVEAGIEALVALPAIDKAEQVRRKQDVRPALAEVIGELFDLLARTRRGADALERSAKEVPELAAMFYAGVRLRLLDRLTALIVGWADSGAIPRPIDAAVTARAAVESVAWLARHRHGDFDGAGLDDELVRATAIDFVTRGIAG
jgi:AcrR family transcriptional regulator